MSNVLESRLRGTLYILVLGIALCLLLIKPIATNAFSVNVLRALTSDGQSAVPDAPPVDGFASMSRGTPTLCRMTSAVVLNTNNATSTDKLTECAEYEGTTGAFAKIALASTFREVDNAAESVSILSGDANIERYLRHQARALLQDDQPETAIATLDMGGEQLRWPSSTMTVRADALLALDEATAAETLYRESIDLNQFDEEDPVNNLSRTLYNLGRLLESQRDWGEAEQVFGKLVQYNEANANAWLRLAITQLSQGELESAETSIRISLEQDTRDWAFAYLGRIVFQQGEYSTAIESWWNAYLVEKNPQFLLEFVRLDETEESAALIRQFGRAQGAQPEDFALLAKTLDEAGKAELAHMLLDLAGALN